MAGRPDRTRRVPIAARAWACLLGVVAAACVLATAELIALVTSSPASSPMFAVGAWAIDLAPPAAKEMAIGLFGTADKQALLILLGVAVLILAAVAGLLQVWRRPWGVVVLVLAAGIAVVAVVTRPHATGLTGVPTILGMILGALLLHRGAERLRGWQAKRAAGATGDRRLDRRSFLRLVAVSGGAALIVGVGARMINAGAGAVTAMRDKIRLPAPAKTAAAIPAGAELSVPGLAPFITPNNDFYRIDTALQVPSLDPTTWRLRITGMVENAVEISFSELMALPLTEHLVTLTCVSNEVGGNLIGNARWLGYPIRELLKRARPTSGADMVLSHSSDGFTAGTPLDVLQDPGREAILAVGMNGQPLPLEHGFPVRMVVPGLYGYVSATKWVVQLEVTTFAKQTGYWTTQGWSPKGPIKTESRIDTPGDGTRLKAGRVAVAGVAWAQHTGIRSVEVRVDAGTWQAARLAESVSADTWRQWVFPWEATSGDHTLTVRATDASGYTQTSALASPVPDGASGWHHITVHVG